MMAPLQHQSIQPYTPAVARQPSILTPAVKVSEAPAARKSAGSVVPGYWNGPAQAYQSEEELWAWWGNWDL